MEFDNERKPLKKEDARRAALLERKKRSREEIDFLSSGIQDELFRNEEYLDADRIFTYVSYNNEVDTYRIIEDAAEKGKKTAVPATFGKKMKFYYVDRINDLKITHRGILEPDSDKIENGELEEAVITEETAGRTLIIVPGVAFDEKCNRAGYGGGFYDSWLSGLECSPAKIALAFEFQIFPEIETEEHDIKPDMIITDKRTIEK